MANLGHRCVIEQTVSGSDGRGCGYLYTVFFGKRKHRLRPRPEPPQNRDARAYVLLEEARLRCEALRADARTPARSATLNRLHRELGLAGLFTSSNLPSSVRHTLLADAHQRCTEALADDAIDALALVMRRSEDAVDDGLVAPGLSDHMDLAHVHLLRAGVELAREVERLSRAAPRSGKRPVAGRPARHGAGEKQSRRDDHGRDGDRQQCEPDRKHPSMAKDDQHDPGDPKDHAQP